MLAYSGCRDLPPRMDPQKYTLRAAGRRCAATSAATGSGITASAGTPNAPSLRRMAPAAVAGFWPSTSSSHIQPIPSTCSATSSPTSGMS